MAETLTFTLELKSRIDKELSKISRSTKAMSDAAGEDVRRFQKKLGGTKTTIDGLNNVLERLRKRKNRAFDTKKIERLNKVITETERKVDKLRSTGLRNKGMPGGGLAGGLVGRFAGPAALGYAGFSLAKKAITGGVELEQNRIAFQTMTGSEEQGSALVDSVNSLANKTPFANSALLDATRTLLNFGFAGQDVLPTLSRLGDVSGGNAGRLSSLALVMGQVRSSGKLMGQDLLQFINAGFNPLQEMAGMTGKSMGELREEMSKGKISYEQVAEAFGSVTSRGGKFYQMMEKQSESMGGKWSTLTGTFSAKLAELGLLFKPVVDGVLDLGIAMMNGPEANQKTYAINAIDHYLEQMKTAGLSIRERQKLIGQFNAQFGEDVLGKKLDIELALDSEGFLKAFEELKKYLENEKRSEVKIEQKEALFKQKRQIESRIRQAGDRIFDIAKGTEQQYTSTYAGRGVYVKPTDNLAQAEAQRKKARDQLSGINQELTPLILAAGISDTQEEKILKARLNALTLHREKAALLPGVHDLSGHPGNREAEKIKKALAAFEKATKKEGTTEKATKKEGTNGDHPDRKTLGELTDQVNTGGRTQRIINLHINNLNGVGEMNNHFEGFEQEYEEKLAASAEDHMKALLKVLNGVSRMGEA